MAKLHLVPECHAETAMVSIIFKLEEEPEPNHADGISKVSKILEETNIEGYINVGFIDKDKKNTPSYFDTFELVEEETNVLLKRHPIKKDFLFIVKPAIEKFILTQLTEINKTAGEFGLPDEFKRFVHKMKKSTIRNDENYQNLLIKLKEQNPSGIAFIKRHIDRFRIM